MEFKICKNCKRRFALNRPDMKYCSLKCRTRFNSKKKYLAVGNTIKYKKEAKKKFANWLIKNRKKHNEVMKKYIRERCKTPEFKAKRRIYYKKKKKELNRKIYKL